MARNTDGQVQGRSERVSGGDENRLDRISDVPDHVLLQILMFLPLIEAVRTCVLSHRWRDVWTRLPALDFDDDAAPRVSRFQDLAHGALRGYADDVDMGDVHISVHNPTSIQDPVRLATTAALAAQRVNSRFRLFLSPAAADVFAQDEEEEEATLQLPCLPRAKELALTYMGVDLRMPETGMFARLTKLFISGVQFSDDGQGVSDVVSQRCPRLESLELHRIHGLKVLTVLAQSLLNLRLFLVRRLERLHVVAENLSEIQVHKCFALTTSHTSMLLDVPMLEKLAWEDCYPEDVDVGLCRLPSCLQKLVVLQLLHDYLWYATGRQSRFTRMLEHFRRTDTLRLEIPIAPDHAEQKELIDNIQLPYSSELELIVNKQEHKIGPTVVKLLQKNTRLRKLSLQIYHAEVFYTPCISTCDCRKPLNWRHTNISLDSLEWFAMHGVSGSHDEEAFICYILRNAKGLCKLSLTFRPDVNPTERFLRKLPRVSMSDCSIEYQTEGRDI